MKPNIIESLLENKIILKDLSKEEQCEVAEKTYRKVMELLNLDKEVIEFKMKDAKVVLLEFFLNFDDEEVENVSNEDFVKYVLDDVLNEIRKDIYIKVGIDY